MVIFFLKKNNLNRNKHLNAKIFIGHTNINKFIDEVITFFVFKPFTYRDIKIIEDKLINSKNKKEVFLTASEKDILILLFEGRKVEKKLSFRKYFKIK